MTTIIEKLGLVFQCALELNEELWGEGIDSAYMSTEQLADHVFKTSGVQITFIEVDVETAHVFGHIERYDDGKTAIIYVVKSASDRFKHAVITKELCQLVLDTRADWQTDGIDTLERLVTPIIEIDAEENIAARSEQLAERLSWELLYPFELRRTDKEKIAAGTLSVNEIATRVRLPVVIVELFFPTSTWNGAVAGGP